MEYFLIRSQVHDEYCALRREPKELQRISFKFAKGVRMGTEFPAGIGYHMDKEHPGMKLADLAYTPPGDLLASATFREMLCEEEISDIEYLNINILNHKGRLASSEYYIVNLLGSQDCLNLNQSVFRRSAINPQKISSFRKMVLDPEKIPSGIKLFRIQEAPGTFVANAELANRIRHDGLTGVKLTQVVSVVGD